MKQPKRCFFSDMQYWISLARQSSCRLLLLTVLSAVLTTAVQVSQWLFLPLTVYILQEQAVGTGLAVAAAGAAAVGILEWLSHRAERAFSQSRDAFRTRAGIRLARRALAMSYAAVTDVHRTPRAQDASAAVGKHIHAPVAHLWKTVSDVLANAVGTLIFTAALTMLPCTVWLTTVTAAVLRTLVHRAVTRMGEKYREEEAAQDARMAYVTRTAQDPSMSKDIRVFGLALWLTQIHDTAMQTLGSFIRRRAGIYTLYNFADAVLTLLTGGVAYAVLIDRVLTQQISLPLFLVGFFAVGECARCVGALLAATAAWKQDIGALCCYREYLEQEDTTAGGELPQGGVPHTLELKNVTFRYPAAADRTLSGITFTLKAGERLAIVGRNGAGKSTLVRLLCGLYDPEEGDVLLDGINVKAYDRAAYHTLFSTVFGDSILPEMTIAQTLAGQGTTVDTARLWACLGQAGMEAFVRGLPRGIDTPIGHTVFRDGIALSGGQAQRLLLARALYKNGDILIFDEPATALDALAVQALYEEYGRMTNGKSAVFVSGRPAATAFCDRILYMKDGVITEEGTHESLMAQNGDYARLYALQSRYYREGRACDDIG